MHAKRWLIRWWKGYDVRGWKHPLQIITIIKMQFETNSGRKEKNRKKSPKIVRGIRWWTGCDVTGGKHWLQIITIIVVVVFKDYENTPFFLIPPLSEINKKDVHGKRWLIRWWTGCAVRGWKHPLQIIPIIRKKSQKMCNTRWLIRRRTGCAVPQTQKHTQTKLCAKRWLIRWRTGCA